MADFSELDLKATELELKRQELEIRRAQLAVEFAKYGFGGTLAATVVGMLLLLALAALQAFTPFKLETWGYFGIAVLILLGSIAYGYLSLWSLPRIAAQLQGWQLAVGPGDTTHESRGDLSRPQRQGRRQY